MSELPYHLLETLVQAREIDDLSPGELIDLFLQEPGITSFLPDGQAAIDPRNGDYVVFNAARAGRPHDNQPEAVAEERSLATCIICQGQTTGIVDVAQLSQGLTFINKNLFPVLFPVSQKQLSERRLSSTSAEMAGDKIVQGLHFLQWTSSLHDKDWHNMPAADRIVVMERLAALESKLIHEAAELIPGSGLADEGSQANRAVLITKNYGHLVGGSLFHGHQQIALSSVVPRRFADNARFEQSHGETFSAHLLRENPLDLTIKDYGTAALVVPYFMRRPYDMMLLLKQPTRRYLHQLDEEEIHAVADGWRDAIRLMLSIMPAIGREPAYNILTNNGPGAGLYFEFQPYTQEFGGFEQLGLLICQADPFQAAGRLRHLLA
jgi:galactose-1-phosphate uridylyltransferase